MGDQVTLEYAVRKPGQRNPAFQAVVQRFCGGRAIGDALTLQQHPLVQGIDQQFCFVIADTASLSGTEIFGLPLSTRCWR